MTLYERSTMKPPVYQVHADWDPEAEVWVATSEDVPGLVTEAETLEGLTGKLRVMIPELLAANEVLPPRGSEEIFFELSTRRYESVPLAS